MKKKKDKGKGGKKPRQENYVEGEEKEKENKEENEGRKKQIIKRKKRRKIRTENKEKMSVMSTQMKATHNNGQFHYHFYTALRHLNITGGTNLKNSMIYQKCHSNLANTRNYKTCTHIT